MYRFLLAGPCLLIALSCAAQQGPSASAIKAYENPAIAKECPSSTTVVLPDQCSDLPPGYGFSPDQPVEWGLAAIRGDKTSEVYLGRLICPDGTQAMATPIDFAPATTPPTSAPSMRFEGVETRPSDFVDRIALRCGDKTQTFYSNGYRCGSPCPPPGFRLMDVAADRHLRRSLEEKSKGANEASLREAEAALAIDPGSEKLYETVAMARFRLARFEESLQVADEGIARIPASLDLPIFRALVLTRLERHQAAYDAMVEIEPRLEQAGDASLQVQALSIKAMAASSLGRREEALAIHEKLCTEMGVAELCAVKKVRTSSE